MINLFIYILINCSFLFEIISIFKLPNYNEEFALFSVSDFEEDECTGTDKSIFEGVCSINLLSGRNSMYAGDTNKNTAKGRSSQNIHLISLALPKNKVTRKANLPSSS